MLDIKSDTRFNDDRVDTNLRNILFGLSLKLGVFILSTLIGRFSLEVPKRTSVELCAIYEKIFISAKKRG